MVIGRFSDIVQLGMSLIPREKERSHEGHRATVSWLHERSRSRMVGVVEVTWPRDRYRTVSYSFIRA